MKPVRIYGNLHDFGSYAQVTRGFEAAFLAHGYTDETLDLVSVEEEPSFDEESRGLATAPIAILTGAPGAAPRLMQAADHAERMVMIAPNSNRLPERMMATVNDIATAILVPSVWAATVLQNYTSRSVIVVPHGVPAEFKPVEPVTSLAELYEKKEFRILHLSSSFGQRKGTVELIAAFIAALESRDLPELATLTLVLTPQAKAQVADYFMDHAVPREVRERIAVRDRLGLRGAAPVVMNTVMNAMHLVCQPSRGEGFGLVPLEALAAGVPVAATRITEHSEWSRYLGDTEGLVTVPSGTESAIDDMPNAVAPTVTPNDVHAALRVGYQNWHALKAAALSSAAAVGKKWSWPNQLAAFIRFVNR